MSCPHIIISEYSQTYHTSPSCDYVLDLLCVSSYNELAITRNSLTTSVNVSGQRAAFVSNVINYLADLSSWTIFLDLLNPFIVLWITNVAKSFSRSGHFRLGSIK